MVADDYALLPGSIAQADRLEYGGVSDIGRHVILVIRRVNTIEYVAAFEVLTGRRMMALKSMWKLGRPPVIRP